MQISGMSSTLTWPHRLCLFRVLGATHCYKPSLLQAHWGRWRYTHLLWPACLFTDCMGSAPSLLSSGTLLMTLLQAFPLLVAGRVPPRLPSPASLFIYSSMRDCPSPPLRCSGRPTLFTTCLFLLLFRVFSSFFPGWGSVCPGGYADLAQGFLWEDCMPLSSPGGLLLSSRIGAGVWWHRSPSDFSV
jgi:hypothetical protein